ncbi:MAG: sortase [Candidatus Paceibacteria bacterium]
MNSHIKIAVRLVQASTQIAERKWSFFAVFAVVFLASTLALGKFDLLPDAPKYAAAPKVSLLASAVVAASSTPVTVIENPVQIEIPTIHLAATISNPTTTAIEGLDQLLLKGAVRYPTSAKLGQIGNVVLFGHSSYLPIVGNQAYKTFDGIQKLVAGDVITVDSAGSAYTYRVRTMLKESANDAGIDLAVDGRVLTLATCNSFGAKTDRFVVTADFVESHVISS